MKILLGDSRSGGLLDQWAEMVVDLGDVQVPPTNPPRHLQTEPLILFRDWFLKLRRIP